MTSWDQIRSEVRSFRGSVQPPVTTIREFVFDSARDRIYFLANDLSRSSKSPMLFRVDLPRPYGAESSPSSYDEDTDAGVGVRVNEDAQVVVSVKLDEDRGDDKGEGHGDLTVEIEELQHSTEQHSHHSNHHADTQYQHPPQEDHDMDLVPFNPDSYQHFASPITPLHIIPNTRESISTSASSTPQSAFFATTANRYPHRVYTSEPSMSNIDQILAAAPVLDWIPVLTEEWLRHCSSLGHGQSDRLSFYQFEPKVNRLLFPYGSVIYVGDVQEGGKVSPQPTQGMGSAGSNSNRCSNLVHNALTAGLNLVSVSGPLTSPRASITSPTACNLDKGTGSSGTKADPRLGGSEQHLIAFTRDNDLWVMTMTGVETQLTFCSRNAKKSDISCGIAEFVMQEEFHRFTNYYWAPPKSKPRHPPPSVPTSPPPPSSQQQQQASTPPPTNPTASALSRPGSIYSSPLSSLGSTPSMGTSETFPLSAEPGTFQRTTERILYLQVSETMVDLVVIQRQGLQPEYEEYRYPHTGSANAVSDLQIVEFMPKLYDEDVVPEPLHKRLWGKASLYKRFPWLEYIVRFGWMPEGDSVWVQILDRRQQITAIITIPLECFMSVTEQSESIEQMDHELVSRIRVIYEEQSDIWINVTDIMYIFSREDLDPSSTEDEEEEDDRIQLIVPSERTGFRQLYLVTHSTRAGSTIVPITAGQYQVADKPITVDTTRQLVYFTAKRDSVLETHLYVASYAKGAPPENVKRLTELGYSHQTTVDVEKDRFLTLYSSVDQSPACAVMHLRWGDCRYASPSTAASLRKEWCPCGCQFPKISSYAFVIKEGIYNMAAKEIRRSPIVGSFTHSGHMRSCSDSSMSTSRVDSTTVDGLRGGSIGSISGFLSLLPSAKVFNHHVDSMVVSTSVETRRNSGGFKIEPAMQPPPSSSGPSPSMSSGGASAAGGGGVTNATNHPVCEFFSFTSSDNVQLHGCFYRPANYVRGQKYPTLLSIYGGPRSQMVSNEYKLPKLLRAFLATRQGHAVVMIDGRGSNDRGLEFEGQLKHQMGQIEIRDQVEGLHFLARPENGGLVDMSRIAISGWSYGGYLSLMALAQYPHIFKVAIAGAPVAQWELYNTAYTERYMGLVHENKEGFDRSSVLHWATKFPDGENRLLIAHGLIDENVHFKNTETLAAELIRHNKPHQIQVYPTERHGLRDARVNEHFETLMFYWLKNYL